MSSGVYLSVARRTGVIFYVFYLIKGTIKPPKQVLLRYPVKTLIITIELISMLNRCGHGITYSHREEMNSVTVPSENGVNK